MEAPAAGQRRSAPREGLCPRCRWVKAVTNERGSRFLRCLRARDDARFVKYPPQPVMACIGFEE
jgi:hypothetical protein